MEGLLFVLSGPSGVGKNTVLKEVLAKRTDLTYSISATTRPPRGQEIDGVNYYFLSEEQFLVERRNNGFLEWAEIYGHYYGTPRKQVLALLQKGQHVILDVDIQGAAQIRENYANAVLIFLYPPSIAELTRRLQGRNT
jgi:guanylate kinase